MTKKPAKSLKIVFNENWRLFEYKFKIILTNPDIFQIACKLWMP